MADYILLQNSDDKVLEEVDSSRFRKTGVPPVLKSEKGIRWLDLVVVNPAQGDGQIKEGPTVGITDTTYTRTWTVRDKTADELSNEKEKEIDRHLSTPGMVAFLQAFDDGTIQPGGKIGLTNLKALIKGA